MPTEPLLQALLFWTLFGIGALSGVLALAGAVASDGDAFTRSATTVAAIACGCCLAGALAMWRRLLR